MIILKNNDNQTIRYKLTPGLFELIISNAPNDQIYNSDNLLKYGNILHHTSAARRNYNKSEQLKGSKGGKWKNILSPLFATKKVSFSESPPISNILHHHHSSAPSVARTKTIPKPTTSKSVAQRLHRKKEGKGLNMRLSFNPIDYVHWDDPNELVDRLKRS